MKRWTFIGPEWKTEDTFRIREILKSEHIPFRMPFADTFFAYTFSLPDKEKRWAVLVRKEDLEKVTGLLLREELLCRNNLKASAAAPCPAGSPDPVPGVLSPVPSP